MNLTVIVSKSEWFLLPFVSIYDKHMSATTRRDWVLSIGWLKWAVDIDF
jgi:hypothetical protein